MTNTLFIYVMLCIVWVPCDIRGGGRGSGHLDPRIEFS